MDQPNHSYIQPMLDWLSQRKEGWRARFVRGRTTAFLFEFLSFGIKQAWACFFGGIFIATLIGTYLYYPKTVALARYDFLVVIAIFIQAMLLWLRLESLEEAKVIFLFHVVGTIMEIFKTSMGSWVYPEASLLRIGGVPLFSGFMYACVGSYIARVWRIMDFHFENYPPLWLSWILAVAIYINFFSHHYMFDCRWIILVAVVWAYGRCNIHFRIDKVYRKMPLVVGFFLVALFIWFAENIATFTRAWTYPDQAAGWHPVGLAKLSAWYLLMIVSFVLVSTINSPKQKVAKSGSQG
jgi:uncharacterized membrane protein YoaT (DUF817 family)